MSLPKLIEIDWPRFPSAAYPGAPLRDELESRLTRLREAMESRRLTHLIIYGDREHYANLTYLTHLDPRFEEALLIIKLHGRPLIVTGNECESYLPISPLWAAGSLRHERFQPFSLLDQPRDASRPIDELFASEGIAPGARVGCVGWKYYGSRRAMDVPAYLVDALRELAGNDAVEDATDLLMHAQYGLRARCSAYEIAFFEYTNSKASAAMRRVHFALRLGMTDHDLIAEARYDGLPLACHMTCKTGPDRISLSSPSGAVVERGYPWSANVSYWGSNICRAGWVAENADDLPAAARDYEAAFAGPYFAAVCEWLQELRIGEQGGVLHDLIQQRLPFERFGIFLNAGHLIHLDEWLSSPIFAGSQIPLASGIVIQTDVIPSSKQYFSTRMEDGVAIADAELRQDLHRNFPSVMERITLRRRFLEQVLSILLPEEILPLSDMNCLVPPYLLTPRRVFAL